MPRFAPNRECYVGGRNGSHRQAFLAGISWVIEDVPIWDRKRGFLPGQSGLS